MMRLAPASRTATIVGLIFALGWPLALAAFAPNQNLENLRQDVTVVICEWLSVAILAAIVVRWERVPFFSTVGLTRPKLRDVVIVAWLAFLAAVICIVLALNHLTVDGHGSIIGQVSAVPLPLRVLLVFTAGVCEEILFRGYALERLKAFMGNNIWLAALVGTVLFTLAHIPRYGLSAGLAGVFLVGAILSAIYVWRRNLAGCIALHWFIDGISLLIIPAFVTIK